MSVDSDESHSPHGCCVCSCILYALVGFVLLLTVLYRTRFRYHVKMFMYLMCMMIGGSLGGGLSVPFGKSTDNHFRIFKIYQWMTSIFNLNFILRNNQHIGSDEPFVLIANHQSALDVLGMSYCWPKNCVVMLKSSLRYLPGFNICAYICESIYINRFSKEKALKTVDNTLGDIINKKRKVWIYPEGTRNPGKTLLPFKKGAFIIAKQAKVPVVCCVFSSHRFFYDYETCRFDDSGEVLVEFLPPVDSNKFETVDELSEYCRDLIQKKHDELNQEMEERISKKIN